MKTPLLIIILFWSLLSQAQYSFPSNIPESDAKKIVERFGVAFLGKTPPALIDDENRTQLNLSWNWISTKEVSKLGSGNPDRTIQYQEFHFSQLLPFQVEIGLHTNLLAQNKAVSTYGGFARWTFLDIPYGSLAIRAHGSSVNYRSLMGVNMAGGLLEANFNLGSFVLSAGFGQLRTTANFKATVFGVSGNEPAIRVGETYQHEMLRLSYVLGRWNVSVQSDQIRDAHNSLMLGYVF